VRTTPSRRVAPDPGPHPGEETSASERDRPAPGGVAADPTARPLRRDAEANRRRILDAAGRLMAERGLATPLEDIAAAAGVGIGTLYRRFPSRTALVDALFEDRLESYVADAEASLQMGDGWDGLVWFLERTLERQILDRGLSQLVAEDPGPGRIHARRERLGPLALQLVHRARASGRLRPDVTVTDLLLVQKMLVAVGAATAHVDPGMWRRWLTIVLDGLVVRRDGPTPLTEPPLTFEQAEHLHAGGGARRGR